MKRPNILFITVDEMRGDCAGYIGNPDVKTPHLDALAARGTVFEKHFAPFPKCVPSRCTMHTGRYPHTDGLRTVMGPNLLPKGDPTLAEFLRASGYETAVLGLNHVWEEDWFYGAGKARNKKSAGAVDYTSFTEGPLADQATRPVDLPPAQARPTAAHPALCQTGFPAIEHGRREGFRDENRADQAILYLKELRNPDRPFFLQVNFSKPHPPYAAHEPYYSMYDPEVITPFPYALPENATLPLRAQRHWRLGDDVPEAALREMQAVYYSMISQVEALVGKVVAALDELELADDTLILFCSDHGDYAGQYGICEKWDADLRDCLLHVPFIMSGPGIPAGQGVAGLSEMVDLPPTILDYLELKKPDDWTWHGQSLLPLLAGGPGKPAVFANGGHEAPMRARFNRPAWEGKDGRRVKSTQGKQLTYQQCPDAMARCKMVRTGDWKLVIRETGGNELFNMREDPFEMNNLYGKSRYDSIVMDLQLQLIEWCLRTDTDRPHLEVFGA